MSDASGVQPLPDSPSLALFLVSMVQRLGGFLSIDGKGRRFVCWPENPSLDCAEGIPQMPSARPWQQFHNDDEWRGAIKLADYWLRRLSERDREFVFTLAAPVCADIRTPFDFRDHLQ